MTTKKSLIIVLVFYVSLNKSPCVLVAKPLNKIYYTNEI